MNSILEHFGLTVAPFNNSLDQKFYFDTPTHQETFRSIEYAIESSKGISLIYGELGTGKSFLTDRIIAKHESNGDVVFVCDQFLRDREILLDQLASKLGLVPKTAKVKGLAAEMKKKVIALGRKKKKAIVIIDDAQDADENMLSLMHKINNMEHKGEKLFQVILVAQPSILEVLKNDKFASLRQRIAFKQELGTLSRAQTIKYILHRIEVANGSEDLFKRNALDAIFESANGIPRLINQVCENCLIAAYHQNVNAIDKNLVARAVKASIAITLMNDKEAGANENSTPDKPNSKQTERKIKSNTSTTQSTSHKNYSMQSPNDLSNNFKMGSHPPFLASMGASSLPNIPSQAYPGVSNNNQISGYSENNRHTANSAPPISIQAWVTKSLPILVTIVVVLLLTQAYYFISNKNVPQNQVSLTEPSISNQPKEQPAAEAEVSQPQVQSQATELENKANTIAVEKSTEVPFEYFDLEIPSGR